jgi:hypothetical protein
MVVADDASQLDGRLTQTSAVLSSTIPLRSTIESVAEELKNKR